MEVICKLEDCGLISISSDDGKRFSIMADTPDGVFEGESDWFPYAELGPKSMHAFVDSMVKHGIFDIIHAVDGVKFAVLMPNGDVWSTPMLKKMMAPPLQDMSMAASVDGAESSVQRIIGVVDEKWFSLRVDAGIKGALCDAIRMHAQIYRDNSAKPDKQCILFSMESPEEVVRHLYGLPSIKDNDALLSRIFRLSYTYKKTPRRLLPRFDKVLHLIAGFRYIDTKSSASGKWPDMHTYRRNVLKTGGCCESTAAVASPELLSICAGHDQRAISAAPGVSWWHELLPDGSKITISYDSAEGGVRVISGVYARKTY